MILAHKQPMSRHRIISISTMWPTTQNSANPHTHPTKRAIFGNRPDHIFTATGRKATGISSTNGTRNVALIETHCTQNKARKKRWFIRHRWIFGFYSGFSTHAPWHNVHHRALPSKLNGAQQQHSPYLATYTLR